MNLQWYSLTYPYKSRKNLDPYFRPNVELVVDDVDAHLQQEALNLVDNINKVTKSPILYAI